MWALGLEICHLQHWHSLWMPTEFSASSPSIQLLADGPGKAVKMVQTPELVGILQDSGFGLGLAQHWPFQPSVERTCGWKISLTLPFSLPPSL